MAVDLDALKKLLAEGTPGPWQVDADNCVYGPCDAPSGCPRDRDIPFDRHDADLIVALRNSAPDLVRELEAARAVIPQAKEAMRLLDGRFCANVIVAKLANTIAAYDAVITKEPSDG